MGHLSETLCQSSAMRDGMRQFDIPHDDLEGHVKIATADTKKAPRRVPFDP
jgi:hypothetical protein